MSNNMNAILVTGGSGFLGTEVCQQLIRAGQKVIDVRHKAKPSGDVISMTADLSDIKQLETIFLAHKISAIIHMAATLTTNSNQNPDLAFRVNVLGSNNLLELTRQYGVKRFIYSSSYSALGYRPIEKCPVDESLAPTPDNFYGETKRFVEALGVSYARKFGFQFTAGRMGAVVGPGNALSTSSWRMDIFNMLKTGGKIETKFSPQVTLSISLLEDTARALVTLALAEKNQHCIYNLPNDSLSLQQIAQMVHTLRPDIEFSFGTITDQDMPPLISADRFLQEFSNFRHVPLAEALRLYQLS
jgi:nucleoside-diphosphate-sugar epimerase